MGSANGRLRGIVLDFDGVVIESNGIKTEVFRELFAAYPEHKDEMLAYHFANISLPRHAKFEHLVYRLLGRPDDTAEVEALARAFSRRMLEQLVSCREVAGAHAFLEEFTPRLPVHLASITPEPELREILRQRGLLPYFAEVYGSPPTPKREAVERVLARYGLAPRAVALVGDSPGDLRVARETGIEFVGRDSGIPFGEPDLPLHPDMHAVANALRDRVEN
jgi:phosphoglycolate phosphatase-like HAD superfamily hydrolase